MLLDAGGAGESRGGRASCAKSRFTMVSQGVSPPSFMMVLTATGEHAYRRDDGVVVCPIGSLKP